jgi:hypothetical protein
MIKAPAEKKKEVFEKKPKATKVNVKPKQGEKDEEQLYDNLKIKEGGLRASLKVDKDYKFTKSKLTPLVKKEVGSTFKFEGRNIKMTEKIKKQIRLAINMMK